MYNKQVNYIYFQKLGLFENSWPSLIDIKLAHSNVIQYKNKNILKNKLFSDEKMKKKIIINTDSTVGLGPDSRSKLTTIFILSFL